VIAVDDPVNDKVDITVSGGGGGVTDHGALTGLGDDDHPQYCLSATFSAAFWDHSARHELGGADLVSVTGLTGLLATQQTPVNHDHTGDAGDGGTVGAKLRTVTKILYIDTPLATDAFPLAFVPDDITIVRVRGVTDAGTVAFNIEHRATNTPGAAGTNTLTSDLVADSGGEYSETFSDATVPADRWLYYCASAIASSPTLLWVNVEYTVD
jgi:hypothetical protein